MGTTRVPSVNRIKKYWICILTLLTVFVTLRQAYAYSPYPFKWADSDIPVSYYINLDNIPTSYGITTTNYVAAVDDAFDEWESVSSSYITFSHGGAGSTYTPYYDNGALDGHNTIGFAQLPAGTAGLTSIWSLGSSIVEVDIRLQSNGTAWSIGAVPGHIDLQSVITHEIGHLGGLGHSDNPDATMYGSSGTNTINPRTLHEDDVAGITFLYYQVPEPAPLSLLVAGGLFVAGVVIIRRKYSCGK